MRYSSRVKQATPSQQADRSASLVSPLTVNLWYRVHMLVGDSLFVTSEIAHQACALFKILYDFHSGGSRCLAGEKGDNPLRA